MKEQNVTPKSREALSRAKFFLGKAKACPASARVDFEAYLEAALMFAQSDLFRVEKKIRKTPQGENWWKDLLKNPLAEFIRNERNWIIHHAPSKIGQRIFLPIIQEEEETVEKPNLPPLAHVFYYYGDDANVPATTFVEEGLMEIERLVAEAKAHFG
jgi:hypothetical protein